MTASLTTLLGVLHALPLAYSKDLQEDKEALFDAVDTVELGLQVAERLLANLAFKRERLAEAASDEMLAATDVADYLVRKGMPFRAAHGIVGGLVRSAIESGTKLSALSLESLRRESEHFDEDYYELFGGTRVLDSKVSSGSTGAAALDEQFDHALEFLGVRGEDGTTRW